MPTGGVHGVDEFARALRGRDGRENITEHRIGNTAQCRNSLTQRLSEIEFAIHRSRRNLSDPLPCARDLGQLFDDLLGDQRRINVSNNEAGCPAGKQQRGTRLIEMVSHAHLVTTVPLGTTVIPDSVTV